MPFVITTPKAVDANSYVTVAQANAILAQRLYGARWVAASALPDAEGFLANGTALAGVSLVPVDGGTGTFSIGTEITFAGHSTVYKVCTLQAGAGSLTIAPALTAGVADNEAVTRVTGSQREQAVLWASKILDEAMVWEGFRREQRQGMRWPRSEVVDPDGWDYDFDTVPKLLEEAVAEYALVLLARDMSALPALLGLGISKAKIGSIDVNISGGEQEALIPTRILSMLSPLGHLESEVSLGSSVLPLRRS